MFLRGDGHALTQEARGEAIRAQGRKPLPRTERQKNTSDSSSVLMLGIYLLPSINKHHRDPPAVAHRVVIPGLTQDVV